MSESETESVSDVFQALQKDFIDLIDLDTFVPQLNAKGLLTSDEEYVLTYQETPPGRRKTTLTQFLRSKGRDARDLVLECLRAEKTHTGHAELAKKLDDFLSGSDGTCHRYDGTHSYPPCGSQPMHIGLCDATSTTTESSSSNFCGESVKKSFHSIINGAVQRPCVQC